MIAALFVEQGGVYWGLPDVDPYSKERRDARLYEDAHPVVAHPECQRWGRFWHGSTRKPHQFKMGDDGGIFSSAIANVRRVGGVLEHPKDSHAWDEQWFNLAKPKFGDGWIKADEFGGMTCCLDQGNYGHEARKPTWLYGVLDRYPELNFSRGEQKIHQWMIDRYGYDKARKIGNVAMIGGKNKQADRNRTPHEFRDVLLNMIREGT